jgi:hypothetical protein
MAADPTGEELRRSRAVLALELAGGPEALALLKEWAAWAPAALVTEEAKSAVGRAGR